MPARIMEEALRGWREAERLLARLPPLTPDHESVRLAIISLRDTYQRVAELRIASPDALASNRHAMEEAMTVIRDVETRLIADGQKTS